MNDLEDRLRTDAAAWQNLVDGGARGAVPTGDRSGRRRWLAPALSAAAVLAVATAVALLSLGGGSDRPEPSGTTHWTTHTFGALTLRYPASWHALNPASTALGPVSYLGYLVSPGGVVRCTRNPKAACDRPVPRLSGNLSVISAIGSFREQHFTANTTVDGRPAILRHDVGCRPGATFGESIEFQPPHESVQVVGCTASSDPADHRVIDRILRSLRYFDEPLVTISGELREVGGPPPGLDQRLPGKVSVRRVGGGSPSVVRVGANGFYSVEVPPGRYTITGTSPRIQSGRAECTATHNPVVAKHSVTADVICSIR